MDREFEWVHYPFKIHKKEDLLLFRVKDRFEMRFTKDVFSKRVRSTPVEHNKNIVEVEITDNEAKIISKLEKIEEFKTAADFYVPIGQEAREFYESIHRSLISNDLNSLFDESIRVEEYIKENGFPEIPLPITSTSSHFENFESAICKFENFPKIPVERVKFGDPVPKAYPKEAMRLLQKNLTKEQFELQHSFYQQVFQKTPISRFRTIVEEYEKRDINFKQGISLNMLKRCVAVHAYFIVSGPWRKCWIRLGFDPSQDPDCYVYQAVEMRSKKANFQLFQRPEIIAEVSKNKAWYLLKECDPIDGFMSQALKNLIIYIIDNANVKEIDKKIEETLDFDLFEM